MKITKLKNNQVLIEGDELVDFDLKVKNKTGLASSGYDDIYESLILLYRFPGMDASKQLFYGNQLSILTILSSGFQNLLDNNIITEEQLNDLVETVKSMRRMGDN